MKWSERRESRELQEFTYIQRERETETEGEMVFSLSLTSSLCLQEAGTEPF